MEWLFSGFLGVLSQVVIYIICFFIGKITAPITMSSELIKLYFPDISKYIWIFQGMALSILILITLIQLMRGMLGRTANGEVDHPGVLMAKSLIAVILIICSMPIMQFFMDMIKIPYTYEDQQGAYFQMKADENLFEGGFTDLMTSVFKESQQTDMAEAHLDQLLGTDSIHNIGEISGFAISLILMLILGWQMIRYLIEILERFILLMILMVTAMFPMAAYPSKATSGIFRKWLEMLFSTALLCFFNMFFLRILSGGFSLVYGSANNQTLSNGTVTNPVLGTFILLAMLRTARSWDHYMSQLLTAAQTGSGLGWEIMSAGYQLFGHLSGRSISGVLHGFSNHSTINSGHLEGIRTTGSGDHWSESAGQSAQSFQKGEASIRGVSSVADQLKTLPKEDQNRYIKEHYLAKGGMAMNTLSRYGIEGVDIEENGDIKGCLKDDEGVFADFKISDCGGAGAFRLDDGYLTLDVQNDEQFKKFIAGFQPGSNEGVFSGKMTGIEEEGFLRFGALSLEKTSLSACVPEVCSAVQTDIGEYQLLDAQDHLLGRLNLLTGSQPAADEIISGEFCNYSFTPQSDI